MPVSAILIDTQENMETSVSENIEKIPGVEIRAIGRGKLAAVTDYPNSKEDIKAIESIRSLTGVLQVSVVFSASEREDYHETDK